MVRVFIIDRHFWPDTNPFAIMLKEIVGWLNEANATVTVITAQPGYRPAAVGKTQPWIEKLDNGGSVYRVPLLPEKFGKYSRNLNYCIFTVLATLLFFILSLASIRQKRACIVSTIPPIVQPVLLLAVSKLTCCKFIFSVQDIYPDVRRKPGQPISFIHRILTAIDCITLTNADRVLVLSADMKNTLEERACGNINLKVLNNFPLQDVPEHKLASSIKDRRETSGRCNFIFAGNLGRYQGLLRLTRFFLQDAPANATLTLMGEGAMEKELKEIVAASGSNKVKFRSWVPATEVPSVLAEFDFGVATLAPDVIKYAFPSKILTYWNLGLPVLTTVPATSALAKQLQLEKLGVTVDPDSMLSGVSELISNRADYFKGVENYRNEHPLSLWRDEWIDIVHNIDQA